MREGIAVWVVERSAGSRAVCGAPHHGDLFDSGARYPMGVKAATSAQGG